MVDQQQQVGNTIKATSYICHTIIRELFCLPKLHEKGGKPSLKEIVGILCFCVAMDRDWGAKTGGGGVASKEQTDISRRER
jgi:hypothetical protein